MSEFNPIPIYIVLVVIIFGPLSLLYFNDKHKKKVLLEQLKNMSHEEKVIYYKREEDSKKKNIKWSKFGFNFMSIMFIFSYFGGNHFYSLDVSFGNGNLWFLFIGLALGVIGIQYEKFLGGNTLKK